MTGAGAERWEWILAGVGLVFLVQLFSARIDALFGRIPKPRLGYLLPTGAAQQRLKPWLLAALLVGMLVWPFMVSRGAVDLATLTLIYIMLGLGLNIVVVV